MNDALADGVLAGDRRALARAITLVESTRDDDRDQADALLERLLPATGKAVRVGISGTPGVGKSTFIETLGDVVDSVAVLAVDPSSRVTGGSLLGDKTRMESLAKNPRHFVRPQPSSGVLGGTAPRTREAVLVCEAAGFPVVVVETVGVGQSETAVADIVDVFVLLLAPGGGDELQGMKRGILELVDVIIVNKADGTRVDDAQKTRDDYASAMRLFGRDVPVVAASALEGRGVADAWRAVVELRARLDIPARRSAQAERALWATVDDALVRAVRADPRAAALVGQVRAGTLTPTRAARDLLGKPSPRAP